MAPRILLLPGMTPNDDLFRNMQPLLPDSQVIDWIAPKSHESLADYTVRLASSLDQAEPCVIAGVSFGGIVAQELAWHLPARACVLISSIRHPRELPPWFRMLRAFPGPGIEFGLHGVGRLANRVPHRVRTASTIRLRKLNGSSGAWYRWATSAVLSWRPRNQPLPFPLLQLHGDLDETFPIRFLTPDRVVAGGGHTLPVSHPREVAEFIKTACDNYLPGT